MENIKEITSSKKGKASRQSFLWRESYTSKLDITNFFNTHFSTAANKLTSHLQAHRTEFGISWKVKCWIFPSCPPIRWQELLRSLETQQGQAWTKFQGMLSKSLAHHMYSLTLLQRSLISRSNLVKFYRCRTVDDS